jgi:hypothetical protein
MTVHRTPPPTGSTKLPSKLEANEIHDHAGRVGPDRPPVISHGSTVGLKVIGSIIQRWTADLGISGGYDHPEESISADLRQSVERELLYFT